MLAVHIIIMLLFIVLAVLSRNEKCEKKGVEKPFRKMASMLIKKKKFSAANEINKKLALLNPAGNMRDIARSYNINKVFQVLIILFFGNLLGLFYALSNIGADGFLETKELKRPGYGEGERIVDMRIYADGEQLKDDMSLTVEEIQYTEEEIQQQFGEIESVLEKLVLGENETPDHVDRDLNLMTKLEGYPVSIDWETDDYTVMDKEGKINSDFLNPDGQLVMLRATIKYLKITDEYEFPVYVYPKLRDPEEALFEAVSMKIDEYDKDSASDENQLLPENIGDMELTYKQLNVNTGLYMLIFSVLAGIIIYHGRDREILKKIAAREREMLINYPEIVSKLTLLLGAGMTIRGAFEKVATDYEKRRDKKRYFAYEEMLIAVYKMRSGTPEAAAYADFGSRCEVSRYNKLGALLSQNLKKGSSGLLDIMEEEMRQAFEDRKSMARKLGEEAGTKLLLPMGMMLMIVMVIVIVPAFLSFGV